MCLNVMAINLSDLKIQYPEFPKYLWDSPTPYSDAMNVKPSRRNPEHTKRPLNTFMLFAKIQRDSIISSINCNHSEISKALGRLWQDLSHEEKEPFVRGAKTLVELHRLEYPNYKYRPRKKAQGKETPVKPTTAAKKPSSRQKSDKPIDLWSKSGVEAEPKYVLEQQDRFSAASPLPQSRVPSLSQYLPPPRTPSLEQLYDMSDGLEALSAPAADPFYFCDSTIPASPASQRSELSQLRSASREAAPTSPLSCQGGLGSPASHLHTPYSPVSSIGSSSGYESEALSHSGLPTTASSLEDMRSQEDWSPLSEPEMAQELQDLEVTPLDETALLNPLAMFPVLDLSVDELDDLGFGW